MQKTDKPKKSLQSDRTDAKILVWFSVANSNTLNRPNRTEIY